MSAQAVLDVVGAGRVIAIIRLPDLSNAVELTRALLDGGIRAVEFTLSNPAAPSAIQAVKEALPEFGSGHAVIGAGTVLSPGQAEMVVASGAQFIVAPNTNFEVMRTAKTLGAALIPGALTPTEIQAAWEAGADAVKVFPIRTFGPQYIRDLLNPLPHLRLIPTSGPNLDNVAEFIRAGVFAVGITADLVSAHNYRDYPTLTGLAREFMSRAVGAH